MVSLKAFSEIKYFDFDTNYLVVANDTLYGRKSDDLLHELFSGNSVSMTYKTGKITDGLASDRKTYNTIYTYSTGDVIMEVYLDDDLVSTFTLAEGFDENNIPAASGVASSIQFGFTGTGTVNEIDYSPKGRVVYEVPDA